MEREREREGGGGGGGGEGEREVGYHQSMFPYCEGHKKHVS